MELWRRSQPNGSVPILLQSNKDSLNVSYHSPGRCHTAGTFCGFSLMRMPTQTLTMVKGVVFSVLPDDVCLYIFCFILDSKRVMIN